MIDISKIPGNQLNKATILHSSGIGRVTNGNNFGATSGEAFTTRRLTEANRTHIGNYSSANVHSDYRTQIRPFSSGTRADITPQRPGGLRPGPAVPPRGPFHQPPRHRFDPYSH